RQRHMAAIPAPQQRESRPATCTALRHHPQHGYRAWWPSAPSELPEHGQPRGFARPRRPAPWPGNRRRYPTPAASSPTHHLEGLPPLHPLPDALELGKVLLVAHVDPSFLGLKGSPNLLGRHAGLRRPVLRVGAGPWHALLPYLLDRLHKRTRRREGRRPPGANQMGDGRTSHFVGVLHHHVDPRRFLSLSECPGVFAAVPRFLWLRAPVERLSQPRQFHRCLLTRHRLHLPCSA